MFPVVGPVKNFRIVEPRYGEIPMDQHGISRYLPFEEYGKGGNDHVLLFSQSFQNFAKVRNTKFEKGSKRPEFLEWPFCDLNIYKRFSFKEN
ncbi:MAG: hypothetical protein IIA14_12180, partial [SAR324 cluster bacterium]|nr:hypothetical protein [SAR324 cluster bacterium]